mmetsp:Transcript_23508/g.58386  ORF Transcript_23508/g.58386 Transcript_23508/m.58386 type:complete len:94 (+) Transcript_23508:789-1070(+)
MSVFANGEVCCFGDEKGYRQLEIGENTLAVMDAVLNHSIKEPATGVCHALEGDGGTGVEGGTSKMGIAEWALVAIVIVVAVLVILAFCFSFCK